MKEKKEKKEKKVNKVDIQKQIAINVVINTVILVILAAVVAIPIIYTAVNSYEEQNMRFFAISVIASLVLLFEIYLRIDSMSPSAAEIQAEIDYETAVKYLKIHGALVDLIKSIYDRYNEMYKNIEKNRNKLANVDNNAEAVKVLMDVQYEIVGTQYLVNLAILKMADVLENKNSEYMMEARMQQMAMEQMAMEQMATEKMFEEAEKEKEKEK